MASELNLWKVLFEMQKHNKTLKYVPAKTCLHRTRKRAV